MVTEGKGLRPKRAHSERNNMLNHQEYSKEILSLPEEEEEKL